MRQTSAPTSPYTFVRGRVKNLEGVQDSRFFSWVRFDLEYEQIVVHRCFVSPPVLEDGDDVAVVGRLHNGRFETLGCAKIGESPDARNRRLHQEQQRQRFWFALACLPGGVLMVLAMLVDSSLYPMLLLATFPIFMAQSAYWDQVMANKELELAIARNELD